MSRSDDGSFDADQQEPFESAEEEGSRQIPPWAPVRPEGCTPDEAGLEALREYLEALVGRSRRFWQSLHDHAPEAMDRPEGESYWLHEAALWGNLTLLDDDLVKPMEVPDVLEAARTAEEQLAAVRHDLLLGLDAQSRHRVLAAEPTMELDNWERFRQLLTGYFRKMIHEGERVEEPSSELAEDGDEEEPETE